MARCNMTNRSYSKSSGKKHHGFTLAELIVVLAILAILAAAGVVTAVGYIRRAKLDKNDQHAITVYIQAIFCKRFWVSFRFNFIFSFAENRPNIRICIFYQSNSLTCKIKSIVSGASLVAQW